MEHIVSRRREKKVTEIENLDSDRRIFWVAIGFFLLSLMLVSIHFFNSSFTECVNELRSDCNEGEWADYRAAWGQFGDFMGGMVNPFLGLLTVYLLVKSLRQNELALKQSRDELMESRRAIELSERTQKSLDRATKEQLKAAKQQNNLSNYFTHRNEYVNYLNHEMKGYHQDFKSFEPRYLHGIIYSRAKAGDLKLKFDILNHFYLNVSELVECIREIQGNSNDERSLLMEFVQEQSVGISASFGSLIKFDQITTHPVGVFLNKRQLDISGAVDTNTYYPAKSALQQYILQLKCYQICLAFDASSSDFRFRWIMSWLDECANFYPEYPNGFSRSNQDDLVFENFLMFRSKQLDGVKNELHMLSMEVELFRPDEWSS